MSRHPALCIINLLFVWFVINWPSTKLVAKRVEARSNISLLIRIHYYDDCIWIHQNDDNFSRFYTVGNDDTVW